MWLRNSQNGCQHNNNNNNNNNNNKDLYVNSGNRFEKIDETENAVVFETSFLLAKPNGYPNFPG